MRNQGAFSSYGNPECKSTSTPPYASQTVPQDRKDAFTMPFLMQPRHIAILVMHKYSSRASQDSSPLHSLKYSVLQSPISMRSGTTYEQISK